MIGNRTLLDSCTAHIMYSMKSFYCSEGAFQNMMCLSIKSLHGCLATHQPFLSFMAICGCHLIYITMPSQKESIICSWTKQHELIWRSQWLHCYIWSWLCCRNLSYQQDTILTLNIFMRISQSSLIQPKMQYWKHKEMFYPNNNHTWKDIKLTSLILGCSTGSELYIAFLIGGTTIGSRSPVHNLFYQNGMVVSREAT